MTSKIKFHVIQSILVAWYILKIYFSIFKIQQGDSEFMAVAIISGIAILIIIQTRFNNWKKIVLSIDVLVGIGIAIYELTVFYDNPVPDVIAVYMGIVFAHLVSYVLFYHHIYGFDRIRRAQIKIRNKIRNSRLSRLSRNKRKTTQFDLEDPLKDIRYSHKSIKSNFQREEKVGSDAIEEKAYRNLRNLLQSTITKPEPARKSIRKSTRKSQNVKKKPAPLEIEILKFAKSPDGNDAPIPTMKRTKSSASPSPKTPKTPKTYKMSTITRSPKTPTTTPTTPRTPKTPRTPRTPKSAKTPNTPSTATPNQFQFTTETLSREQHKKLTISRKRKTIRQ
eukprot:NODE_174_length_14184_cov_0.583671.p5 type:complete len:336 gc:universal NODE_174_length_14184_cov_0.583671:12763-11756(-)